MDIQTLQKAFEHKGYSFRYFDTAAEAADYLDGTIDGMTVGFGDSQTLLHMGLYERLCRHNPEVWSPMHIPEGGNFYTEAEKCMHTQAYLVSVNAATESGELVNIDGFGNRVSSSLYCHEKIWFVFGKNKIVPTIEDAVWRARNVAAPQNAKRLGKKTPCAIEGDRCYNCSAPDRICNALMIHLHKTSLTPVEVVIIGEDLGL